MNKAFRILLGLLLATALLAIAAGVAGALLWHGDIPDLQVTLNGEPWEPAAAHGAAAGVAVALVMALVVPLALLLGLGLPLLLVGLVLAAVLLAVGSLVAVATSPLILLVLLAWWLVRRDRAATR